MEDRARPTVPLRRAVLQGIGAAAACAVLPARVHAAEGAAIDMPTREDDLCFAPATELVRALATRRLSARELMQAHLDRIARLNTRLNAIVAQLPDDQCLALADEADRRLARGDAVGPLHGLPWAFKDLEDVVGFPNTMGSRIFRNFRPTADDVLVERLRAAGVLPIGKTNVPEFGMGSQSYNEVYGTTRNPWDPTKTAGGSSGGAGAALAAGLVPLADGSDYAGSLRNPASFNNIVAFRPTVGLVPMAPTSFPFFGFAVKGPMGRSVADVAFLLSVMAGADARDPGCWPSDPASFRRPLERDFRGVRVAWCPDLGGLPLDTRVRAVLNAQRATFESLGCSVDDAAPDLSGVEDVFLTLRRWRSHNVYRPLLEKHRELIKPEAVAEIEAGAKLTGSDVARAWVAHAALMERVRRFQQTYEFTVCTVSQVPPFDADLHWPTAVDGVPMPHYLEWMRSAWAITSTWCPAAAVPAGFTPEGLPVGLQIVGRYRDDFGTLQLAHAFEQATGIGRRRPPLD